MTTTTEKKPKLDEKTYIAAVGRRKTAVALVRIYKGTGFIVNTKSLEKFFIDNELPLVAKAPLTLIGDDAEKKYKVEARVKGGGKKGQAEAIRLGLSRALQTYNKDLRLPLKKAGFLKRDSRMKERKKYGLRGARRAPQWAKR
ncbi:30S ribosomal protein S9 [Patescibacteria group bacterium]|nr:30S ribosomal protein S9 [Patescibacteria group bacterium]